VISRFFMTRRGGISEVVGSASGSFFVVYAQNKMRIGERIGSPCLP
jgi:hypothetical protein